MRFTQLENLNAFSPGSTLWIVADQTESTWAQKVDWELGFQLSRSDGHKKPAIPKPLAEVTSACKFENLNFETDSQAPTMVASQQYLPNRFTVKVPFNGDKEKWLSQSVSIWKNLICPPVRFFLPDELSIDDFKKKWPAKDVVGEVSIVK